MIEPQTRPLEIAVRGWIATGAGIPSKYVIPGNTSNPTPAGVLYATVTMLDNRRDGTPWTRTGHPGETGKPGVTAATGEPGGTGEPGLPGTWTYVSRSIRYVVTFYRDGAQDAALAFQTWAGGPYGTLDADSRGLTFLAVSSIRNADALVSSRWEKRAQLDLKLGVVTVDARPYPGGFDALSLIVVPDTLPRREIRPQ